MAEQDSSLGCRGRQPEKPFPEFPLTAHRNGQWCRKIRGKVYFFGVWAEPMAALEKHNAEYPYLKAGVPVPGKFEGPTVKELIDNFLNHKQKEANAGIISSRWVKDLHDVGKAIVAVIDKSRPVESLGPDDFAKLRLALLTKHSPAIAKNFISRARSIFRYAKDTRKIATEVDFGIAFKPPAKAMIRRHRAAKPKQLWTAKDFRALLKAATPVRKAMLLLSLNCAFNGADIAGVPIQAFDPRSGWLDFPRTKSGVERRVPLWPETVAAVRAYLKERPEPSSEANAGLLFVTRWGKQWTTSGIGHELVKLQEIAKVEAGTLLWGRKTLQTVGESNGDIVAVRAVMGHVDDSMSAEYRQEVTDERLKRVTDTVRAWLFPKQSKSKGGQQ